MYSETAILFEANARSILGLAFFSDELLFGADQCDKEKLSSVLKRPFCCIAPPPRAICRKLGSSSHAHSSCEVRKFLSRQP